MSMYFGLPLCIEDAFRIFGLDFDVAVAEELKKRNWDKPKFGKMCFYPLLDDYFESKGSKLKIYHMDKGQFVVGYEVPEPSDVWTTLINVDQMIMRLCELRMQFAQETAALNADLSEVTLETMEGDPDMAAKVAYPAPYILIYTDKSIKKASIYDACPILHP